MISQLDYIDGYSYYVFWERSEDSLSTDIYVKNLYGSDDPQVLISDGEHHFRNPRLIINQYYYPADTVFYLMYEYDSSGNIDICIVEVSTSGISDPIAVSTDPKDDIHMRCNNEGFIVWENSGQILSASIEDMFTQNWYVSAPVIISDTNSYAPVINSRAGWTGMNIIAWTQPSDSNNAIYISQRTYQDSSWSEPVLLYDSGNNQNLRFCNDFWEMGMSLLVWDKEENGVYTLMGYDFTEEDYFISEFTQDTPFHPTILPIFITVDAFYNETFLALEWNNGGQTNILVNPDPWIVYEIEYYVNISDNYYSDRNPQLFEGLEHDYYYKDCILIWESQRNSHWQLWSSIYTMPMGGINERNANTLKAKASPNPFTTTATIEFALEGTSKIQISIFNTIGEKVYQVEDTYDQGTHKVTWSPGRLPAGLYHVVLNSGDRVSIMQLVKQ